MMCKNRCLTQCSYLLRAYLGSFICLGVLAIGCGDDGGGGDQNPCAPNDPCSAGGQDAGQGDVTPEDSGAYDVGSTDDAEAPDPLLPAFEDLPTQETLPELLKTHTGARVETAHMWNTTRRPEVARLLEWYAFGQAPDPPTTPANVEEVVRIDDFLDGAATLRSLRVAIGPSPTIPVDLLVITPNAEPNPTPIILAPNFFGNHTLTSDPRVPLARGWVPARAQGASQNRATEASRGTYTERWPLRTILERGYGIATFYHGDIEPDRSQPLEGIRTLYPSFQGDHDWGTLAAWSWGLSRMIDVLVTDPKIDPARIAVFGHSRNGKVALWSAAQDARVGLVASHMSGCMGAALSRRRMGETLLFLNASFPHWFTPSFQNFSDNEAKLPFDQHYLIALSAPRPVLIISGEDDAWADPEGEFFGGVEASPAYALLGQEALGDTAWPATGELLLRSVGYVQKAGGHEVNAESWDMFLTFADHHLKR